MSRPRLRIGPHLAPGIVAVALFGVFAAVFVQANIGTPAGFGDANVTNEIGYAMLSQSGVVSESELGDSAGHEGFLVSFILIALVLDAALDGALHLARREDDGEIVSALRSDGGDN